MSEKGPEMDQVHEDITDLRGSVGQVMQLLQELRVRMDNQQPVVSELRTPVVEQPAFTTPATWPTYGLPHDFVHPVQGQATVPLPTMAHQAIPTFAPNAVSAQTQPFHNERQPMFEIPDMSEYGDERHDRMVENLDTLEKRLRAIEGDQVFGAAAREMCLVSGLAIPRKFKTPHFDLYEGATCPKSHLIMYYRKMAAYVDNDKLLIHCFQDSLKGAPAKWYLTLDRSRINCFQDLADAFIQQYKYNMDLAPDRRQLLNMSAKTSESFKEYAQRWRGIAAQVEPPLTDKELSDLFTDTLRPEFYERMVGSVTTNFSELVAVGIKIEAGLKSGKMIGPSRSNPKKPILPVRKKKEGETNAISSRRSSSGKAPMVYQQQSPRYAAPHYAAAVVPHFGPSTAAAAPAPLRQASSPAPQQMRRPMGRVQFPPIPMTYANLYPSLVQKGLVTPRPMGPPPNPLPPFYNPRVSCPFHCDAPGHDIENCLALKHIVRKLMEAKILTFGDTSPNVQTNPLPAHGNVNALDDTEENLTFSVDNIKTPLPIFHARLVKAGLLDKYHLTCDTCWDNPKECRVIQDDIQRLINQGLIQVGTVPKRKEEVAVIEPIFNIPEPREVRPIFNLPCAVFRDPKTGKGESQKSSISEVRKKLEKIAFSGKGEVSNVVNQGRMTRSGRIFAPPINPPPLAPQLATTIPNDKGKSPAEADDEVEFLRMIKRSDYKVIDQLYQTPSKISILSLLMSSPAHRDALLKLLTKAHVTQDISVNQFDHVIANITACNNLSFSNEELPKEGRKHGKALHISVKCQDDTLARVLVDTGSSLNVLPKRTLSKLSYQGVDMTPSSLVVKAFDGSQRAVIGEVELPILIGPHEFNITFQVMDIHPNYSCLLGRPWIHGAGAVTSTLHQKLKFVVGGQLITINGEEDQMISQLSSFKYIDEGENASEIAFQSLEIAQVALRAVEIKDRSGPSFVSLKSTRETMKNGIPEGWGKVVEVKVKKDRFGLGYKPTKGASTSSQPPKTLQERFVSSGFQVNAIVEDFEEADINNLVRHRTGPLTNWEAIEMPILFPLSM